MLIFLFDFFYLLTIDLSINYFSLFHIKIATQCAVLDIFIIDILLLMKYFLNHFIFHYIGCDVQCSVWSLRRGEDLHEAASARGAAPSTTTTRTHHRSARSDHWISLASAAWRYVCLRIIIIWVAYETYTHYTRQRVPEVLRLLWHNAHTSSVCRWSLNFSRICSRRYKSQTYTHCTRQRVPEEHMKHLHHVL